MANKLFIACLLFLLSISASASPKKSALTTDLQKMLRQPWVIDSLKIEAKEEIGTKTEPVFKHRLVVEIEPTENLYRQVAYIMKTPVVVKSRKRKKEKDIHFIATSVYKNGAWINSFSPEANPYKDEGKPLSAYKTEPVMENSSEHKALITHHNDYVESQKTALIQYNEELKQVEAELATATEKYNAAFKNHHNIKRELRNKSLKFKNEKGKVLYARADNSQRDQLQKSRLELSKKINEARRENQKLIREQTKAPKAKNAKLRSELYKLKSAMRKETAKLKRAKTKEIKEARKTLDADALNQLVATLEEKYKADVKAIQDKHSADSQPIIDQQKQLKEEIAEITLKLKEEHKVEKERLSAEYNAEKKQVDDELQQQKDANVKVIEDTYNQSKQADEEKLNALATELEAQKANRDKLRQRQRNLQSKISRIRFSNLKPILN